MIFVNILSFLLGALALVTVLAIGVGVIIRIVKWATKPYWEAGGEYTYNTEARSPQ